MSYCLLFGPEFRLIGLVTAELQDLFLGKSEIILSLFSELGGGPSGVDVFVLRKLALKAIKHRGTVVRCLSGLFVICLGLGA